MNNVTKMPKKMSLLQKMQAKKALKAQRGEMPIGPILIIALIVLPLVIILVVFGGKAATDFNTKATNVMTHTGTIK